MKLLYSGSKSLCADGLSNICSACARGSTVVVDFLLSNGAEVNLIDEYHWGHTFCE